MSQEPSRRAVYPGPLAAVIWDFDGTLADTRARNLVVTRKILAQVGGEALAAAPPLRDIRSYSLALRRAKNWRELYRREFGLPEELIDAAGRLWTTYQLADRTPYSVVPGLAEAVVGLGRFQQGIVSQGSRAGIARWLEESSISQHIGAVVGYEEVPSNGQKPHPDGLLLCLEQLRVRAPATVLFVGDHETDAATARNANAALTSSGDALRIVSIGVTYCEPDADHDWECQPDHWATTPSAVVRVAGIVENHVNGGSGGFSSRLA